MRRAGGYRGWSAQQLPHISEEISKTSIKPITGCRSPLADVAVLWHFNLRISSSDLTGDVLPGVPAWWPLPVSCRQVCHWITVVSLGTMCQKGKAGECWLSPSLRDQQQLLFPGLEQCRACWNHAWVKVLPHQEQQIKSLPLLIWLYISTEMLIFWMRHKTWLRSGLSLRLQCSSTSLSIKAVRKPKEHRPQQVPQLPAPLLHSPELCCASAHRSWQLGRGPGTEHM